MSVNIAEQFAVLHLSHREQLAEQQLLSTPAGVRLHDRDVLVAIDGHGRHLVLVPTVLDRIKAWSTAGVRLRYETSGFQERRFLVLECHVERLNGVFSHLAADLLQRLARVEEGEDSYPITLAVLEEWKELFSRSDSGLSREKQQGLFAELHFLGRLGELSPTAALESWTAAQNGAGYRDFQMHDLAVEVKGITAHTGGEVTVNGLDQLDPLLPGLHLHVVRLEIGPNGRTLGERLEELIYAGFPAKELHGAAKAWGYSHHDEELRFTVQESHTWLLHEGMPFLSRTDIPEFKRAAIEQVNYSVPLAAVAEPPMDEPDIRALLEGLLSDHG